MDKIFCVTFHNVCDASIDDVLDSLEGLKKEHPEFIATAFVIPQLTTDANIQRLKEVGDWLQLAPYGWRRTMTECLSWSKEEALYKLKKARKRGLDALVFRAPGWHVSADTIEALEFLGYTHYTRKEMAKHLPCDLQYVNNLAIYASIPTDLDAFDPNQLDVMFGEGVKFTTPEMEASCGSVC